MYSGMMLFKRENAAQEYFSNTALKMKLIH